MAGYLISLIVTYMSINTHNNLLALA